LVGSKTTVYLIPTSYTQNRLLSAAVRVIAIIFNNSICAYGSPDPYDVRDHGVGRLWSLDALLVLFNRTASGLKPRPTCFLWFGLVLGFHDHFDGFVRGGGLDFGGGFFPAAGQIIQIADCPCYRKAGSHRDPDALNAQRRAVR
jgi:hypothetical protein